MSPKARLGGNLEEDQSTRQRVHGYLGATRSAFASSSQTDPVLGVSLAEGGQTSRRWRRVVGERKDQARLAPVRQSDDDTALAGQRGGDPAGKVGILHSATQDDLGMDEAG